MSELSTIIKQNKPFLFEGLDIRPSFRANDAGSHTYSVNIMVTEEQWNALKTIPRHKLIGGMLYWYEQEEDLDPKVLTEGVAAAVEDAQTAGQKKEKAKKEPSLYGYYWSAMHAKGFDTYLDLQEALNCDYAHVAEALRCHFGVEHRSDSVGPTQFENFVKEQGLNEGLITLSRNAQQAAVLKQERLDKGND